MDTRRFLLAEHYDSLGLFKMADSLDKYDVAVRTSQYISDPARGGLDDKDYPVQKPKPFAPKSPKNDAPMGTSDSTKSALETAKVISQVSFPIFTLVELNNLSKEALNLHAIQKLSEIAKLQKISPKQLSYVKSLATNSRIKPEILQVLNKVSNDSLPLISEIEILKAKMPNLANAAENLLNKLKLLAKNNPAQAQTAEKVVGELSKKVSVLRQVAKVVPVALIFLQLYLYRKEIKNYFDKISTGQIDEIWNDATERAKFITVLLDVISSFTVLFPPLSPLTSALMAISFGISTGMTGIEKYRELSGEKEKQDLDMQFNYRTDIKNEYAVPDTLIERFDKNKNIKEFVRNYITDVMKNTEAKYAMKLFVVPKLYDYIRLALGNSEPELKLKISDLMNLSVLTSDITENRKNKQVVTKSLPDFLKNPTDPKNKMAFYEFRDSIKNLVPVINKMYVDFINSIGPKK